MAYLKKLMSETQREKLIHLYLSEADWKIPLENYPKYVTQFYDDLADPSFHPLGNVENNFAGDLFRLGRINLVNGVKPSWELMALAAHQNYYYYVSFHDYLKKGGRYVDSVHDYFDFINLFYSYLFFVHTSFTTGRDILGDIIYHYFYLHQQEYSIPSFYYTELSQLCLFSHAVYTQGKLPESQLNSWDLGFYADVFANVNERAACESAFYFACDSHLHLIDENISVKDRNNKYDLTPPPQSCVGLYSPELLVTQKILKDYYSLDIKTDHPVMQLPASKTPDFKKLPVDKLIYKVREVCEERGYEVPELASYDFENNFFDEYFS